MIPWRHLETAAVIPPNWLGDVVMALPALERLRAATPQCHWQVLARPAVADLFTALAPAAAHSPDSQGTTPAPWSVHRLPSPGSQGTLAAWWASRRQLRQLTPAPELVLVLPNSLYSAALARSVPARWRAGYARNRRGALLSHAVPPPAPGRLPGHESFYYLDLLRRLGAYPELAAEGWCDWAGLIGTAPAVIPLSAPAAAVRAMAQRLGPVPAAGRVVLHAGSSTHPAKRWLPDRFAALAVRLAKQGCQVVLIGSPAERPLAEQVRQEAQQLLPSGSERHLVSLAGQTTLHELLAILAGASLLVANDSGPMHLAGALGTPIVALFGPTNHLETFPLTRGTERNGVPALQLLRVADVACSPCKLRHCPIDHRCMTRLSLEQVEAAVLRALNGAPAASHTDR